MNPVKFFSIGVCLALLGCATVSNFEKFYSRNIGGTVEQLLSAWGQPQAIIELPNGNKEYAYNLSRNNNPLPDTCIIFYEANKENLIIAFRHEGKCKRAPSIV